MSESPTPEDLSRDLRADLAFLKRMVFGDAYLIGTSAVRRAMDAERERGILRDSLKLLEACLTARVELLECLLALEAAEISEGQACRLAGVADVIELREARDAALEGVRERWRAWREGNPPKMP